MKRFFFPLIVLVLLAVTGCAGVIGPVKGSIYTNVSGPFDSEIYDKGIDYAYEGMACATSYLGLIALGDASISAAKRGTNMKKVVVVDYRVDSFLGFYAGTVR